MLPGRNYTPEDIAAIAWRRRWILAAATALTTVIAVGVSLRMPDLYDSETVILVIPQRVPESYVRSTVTMRIEDRLRSIKQEILSRSRLERIIRDFNLYADQIDKRPMEAIVADMRDNVVVDTVRGDAFKVRFVADSPRTAMIVTDRLASMFIEENLRDREIQADGTNHFLETQLNEARARLETHEQKLEDYRRRYSGELPSQLQGNLQVIQSTQSQIQNLTESINRDRDRRLVLERALSDAGSAAPDALGAATAPGAAEPVTREAVLVEQLDKARQDLRDLRLRLKSEHPDVIAKTRTVAELEQKVREASEGVESAPRATDRPATAADLVQRGRTRQFQSEIDKLDGQVAGKETEMQRLRQVMSDYQNRVEAVPGHESELTSLMRDYQTLQKIYDELLSKKQNSQMSANLERQQVGEQFKILDPARLPEKPFSPNRPQYAAIGAALGLLLSFGLMAFIEYRDETLRTEDEIVRTLVLPVISAIPVMVTAADLRRQRRNRVLLAVATVTMVVGASVTLWQLAR